MPRKLRSKVWWISIGANDLMKGGCSEEVVILGILRIAEEVAAHDPDSIVVIQGLLPQSTRSDGSVDPRSFGHHVFASPHSVQYKVNQARDHYQFWPSIKNINKELQDFCSKHEHIVFFDASVLFLGNAGNDHYHSESQQILKDLMPDYRNLSFQGHVLLTTKIVNELHRIIEGEDESNDIEVKEDQ
jgi:hypothetical protein